MAYTITDLGSWERYQPEEMPEHAPPTAMFSRRNSDGKDWYDLSRNDEFADETVFATLDNTPKGWMVQAVVRDPSLLFPQGGQRLITIDGVDPHDDKPHKLFERRLVDLSTGKFSEPEVYLPVISDRQFFQALASSPYNIITMEEAKKAVKIGEMPGVIQNVIDSIQNAEERDKLDILLSGAKEFKPDHPAVGQFISAIGWGRPQFVTFWLFAAGL